jgi:tetratricopeptide repeat protein 21B
MQSESVDKERIVAADINYKLGQYLEEREANP